MLQVGELETKLQELRSMLASEQARQEATQKAMAAEQEDIAKQGAALVDMGKQVTAARSKSCCMPHKQLLAGHAAGNNACPESVYLLAFWHWPVCIKHACTMTACC